MAMSDSSANELSYRERDQAETLDNHEKRITRLEKFAYVGMGAIAAQSDSLITLLTGAM